jgi:hypothetical protein
MITRRRLAEVGIPSLDTGQRRCVITLFIRS